MSDHPDKKDQHEEQEHKPENTSRPPTADLPDEEETTTISLLDLISETSGSGDIDPYDEHTGEIPSPLVVNVPDEDDQTTGYEARRQRSGRRHARGVDGSELDGMTAVESRLADASERPVMAWTG